MNCDLGKSKLLIGTLIVLLFMYAYKIYQKKRKFFDSNDNEDDEVPNILNKVRKGKDKKEDKKKVKFDENSKPEINKDKIGKLVNEILQRQIPT